VIVAPTAIPPERQLKASGRVAASDRFENDYDKEVYNGDLGVVSHIDIEPGSQLDWLISTTAMIVLSWSRATRTCSSRSAGASRHSIG
jgi:hypothetical protein